MTPQQIAVDVARGLEIKAEIKKLTAELKAIEARLETAGLGGEQIPLKDENREGKQFIARGARHVLPVRFESDLIMGSFEIGSPTHVEIAAICGELLPRFFKPSTKLDRVPKDGEAFRKLARKLLEPEPFAKLIRAATARDKDMIAKCRTVVAWDDAKTIESIA